MKAARTYISFTEVTDRTKHQAYNAWHMLDHRPENIALPGIIYGERFVCAPDCAAKVTASDPAFYPFHYLLMYWMQDPMEETWKAFRAFADTSILMGRRPEIPYSSRRLQGIFYPLKGYAAPRVLVSPEAIPYRPARGLYVQAFDLADPASGAAQELLAWYDLVHIPAMLECRGVAGAWMFGSDPVYSFATSVNPNTEGRIVQVYYLDEEPLETIKGMESQQGRLRKAGQVAPKAERKDIFAGPLRTIEPWQWDWFDEKEDLRHPTGLPRSKTRSGR